MAWAKWLLPVPGGPRNKGQQGHRILYREAHALLDDLADAQLVGARKE